jgi:hypothetical protein
MNGTRQKTLSEQLSQTLVTEGWGEALDALPHGCPDKRVRKLIRAFLS